MRIEPGSSERESRTLTITPSWLVEKLIEVASLNIGRNFFDTKNAKRWFFENIAKNHEKPKNGKNQ